VGPAWLSVTLTPDGNRCIVEMAGTLDASSTAAVDTQYDQLLGAGFDEVVLDVSGVQRVDESGAAALAQLWSHLRNCGVFGRVNGLALLFADSPIELLLFIRRRGTDRISPSGGVRPEDRRVLG
jgi:ABC-type transporter Mla MlaB component